MKQLLLITGLTAFCSLMAVAGPVTFSTTGVFNCNSVASCVASSTGGGTNNVVTVNGITLSFASVQNSLTAPTYTNFGTLTSACVLAGCTASPSALAGIQLVLTITQSVPTIGSVAFSTATLTGSITAVGTSTAQIDFGANNTSSALCPSCPGVYINPGPNQVLYQIPNGNKSIVPPASGAAPGLTSLQGAVTDAPEPVTMSLVGLGLVALATARRFRRA